MKEESVCALTLSRHVTPWVFFQSDILQHLSHKPPSPWVTEITHSRTGEKGGRFRSAMASVSLVSSPPAPVLDKNMTDSELAGDERSSNIIQFLIRSICAIQCCWVYMLVWLVFLSFNHELQGVRDHRFPPLFFFFKKKKSLHASSVQIRRNAVKRRVDFLFFLSSPSSSTRLTHDHFHAKIAELIVSVVVSVGWIHGFILLPSAGGYANNHDVNATPIFVLLLPLQATMQYCQPGFTQGWP